TPYPLCYGVIDELYPASLNKWDDGADEYYQMGQPEKFSWNRVLGQLIFLGWKRNVKLTYPLDGLPRGEHTFRAVQVATGDWFGFVQKTHVFPITDYLVVQPNPFSIDMQKLPTSFAHGSVASNAWNSNNTNIATGIREY